MGYIERRRGADMPLAAWVEEFLLLARRLSPTTVQTSRRDLERYEPFDVASPKTMARGLVWPASA